MDIRHISANLKLLRKKHSLKQVEMAQLISIGNSQYQRFEAGKCYPKIIHIVNMCKIFDIKVEYFLIDPRLNFTNELNYITDEDHLIVDMISYIMKNDIQNLYKLVENAIILEMKSRY